MENLRKANTEIIEYKGHKIQKINGYWWRLGENNEKKGYSNTLKQMKKFIDTIIKEEGK